MSVVRSTSAACVWALHGRPDGDSVQAMSAASGLALPAQVNHKQSGRPMILAVGPGEWLLRHHVPPGDDEFAELAQRLAGQGYLFDLGAAWQAVSITGARCEDVMRSLFPADITSEGFGVEQCRRLPLREIDVVVHRTHPQLAYEILVQSSVVRYLEDWVDFAIGCLEPGG